MADKTFLLRFRVDRDSYTGVKRRHKLTDDELREAFLEAVQAAWDDFQSTDDEGNDHPAGCRCDDCDYDDDGGF